VEIPQRLRDFYAGDFLRYHRKFVRAHPKGWGEGWFQVALTPPSWKVRGDSAINGPRGQWKEARFHVPLFVTHNELDVVADIRTPACPIGWYSEEECRSEGPTASHPSLDAFLEALADAATGAKPGDICRPQDAAQTGQWRERFTG